jgi:DNA modification methylase
LSIQSIVPDPTNPRRHTREQIRAIARSIEAFGFNAPILVDSANRVVAGHGRLEAAKLLEIAEAPVIRLEHLSEQQAKAYMLADNKLTDRSSWDDRKVAIVLKELSDIAVDFEIEATGFEAPEIDLRIQSLEPPDESADSADEFETSEGPPVSCLGDLWALGDHRLLCGNALDSHAYGALLAGEKAGAVFTDPPYNVRVKGHVSGKGARQHREFPMAAGELTEDAFCRFLVDAFGLMVSHSVDGGTFFACMDWRHVFEIVSAIRALGCAPLNLCVWVKTNGGMGSLYRSRHELVLVFGRRDATRVNNVQLGRHGRNRTNVWNYPGMNSFARRGRTRGLDLHPTVKPIAMVSDAILDVTQRGDIVLDPFCGSGTTILRLT